jgi:taurine dioxygenase
MLCRIDGYRWSNSQTMGFDTRQLHPGFGLEIVDVDLAGEFCEHDFAEIVDLYNRHSMLLFRHQSLTPAAQAALARRFGAPKIETRKQFNFREHPEVSTIGNIVGEGGRPLAFFVRGGFGWHTDGSAACHVNAATMLYAVEVPRDGGDTLFLSSAAAYDDAPRELLDALAEVSYLTSFHAHNDPLHASDPAAFIPLSAGERDALPPVWHRVVQTHPVSGRKLFYLHSSPIDFDAIDPETGKRLLQQALDLASAPERVYRHRWQPGELIIWDNHAMMHSGTPTESYEADRRLMLRSFVYTLPTARSLANHAEQSRIFMPDENSISVTDFDW